MADRQQAVYRTLLLLYPRSFRDGYAQPMAQLFGDRLRAPIAALLGAVMLLGGVGTVFEAHNLGGRIFGSGLLLALGSMMLLGLMRRPFDRVSGNSMILLATIPAFAFFWIIVPAVAGALVWLGVLSAGFNDEPAPATAG